METRRPWTVVENSGDLTAKISFKAHGALRRTIKTALKKADIDSDIKKYLETCLEESKTSRFTRGQRMEITSSLRSIN